MGSKCIVPAIYHGIPSCSLPSLLHSLIPAWHDCFPLQMSHYFLRLLPSCCLSANTTHNPFCSNLSVFVWMWSCYVLILLCSFFLSFFSSFFFKCPVAPILAHVSFIWPSPPSKINKPPSLGILLLRFNPRIEVERCLNYVLNESDIACTNRTCFFSLCVHTSVSVNILAHSSL